MKFRHFLVSIATFITMSIGTNAKELLKALDINDTSVKLNLIKPDNGGELLCTIISEDINNDMFRIHLKSVDNEKQDSTIYTVQHLSPGHTYKFKAICDNKLLHYYFETNITTVKPMGMDNSVNVVQNAKGSLEAFDVTDTSVKLKFIRPEIGGKNFTYVFFAEEINTRAFNFCVSKRETSSPEIYTVYRLSPGHTYRFIAATDNDLGGSFASNTITTDNPLVKPGKPRSRLKASVLNNSAVLLEWRKPADDIDSVVSYRIIVCKISLFDTRKQETREIIIVSNFIWVSHTVTNLNENFQYRFKVSAFNNKGESACISTDNSIILF